MHRTILSAICVAAATVLYIFTRTGSALLLLCASVIFPCASLILGAVAVGRVSVALSIPAGLHKGKPARCALSVENSSFAPVTYLELTLDVRNTLTGRGDSLKLTCAAPPFGKSELEFIFESAYCGQYIFSSGGYRVYDTLGLRGVRRDKKISEKRVVPPDMFPMKATLSGAETPPGGGEVFSVPRKGQDRTEPLQIRDYAEGDTPKQIHWKLTQKFGRYIVTDPSLELEQALLIVWDSGLFTKDMPPEIPDTLVEVLVSMCLMLTENGVPYDVIWKCGESGEIILKDVSDEENIFEVIPGVLCANSDNGGTSLIPEFMTLLNGKKYPQIAYFSCRVPIELDELVGVGKITTFLCGAGTKFDGEDSQNSIQFSPANYMKALRDVTI